MIKLLDSDFKRICNLKTVLKSNRTEQINDENTLSFELIADSSLISKIQNDSIFELDGDYFDLAYKKNKK